VGWPGLRALQPANSVTLEVNCLCTLLTLLTVLSCVLAFLLSSPP
jgi:hypothetical protein